MTYSPKTRPYAHQTTALAAAAGREAFAYFMEMGTGKTKVAIDEVAALHEAGSVSALLVLAPKGVYMNWVRTEFPAHLPDRVAHRARIVEWRAGGGGKKHTEKLEALLQPRVGALAICVMNIEALSSGDRALKFAAAFLRAYAGESVLVVDECFPAGTVVSTPEGGRKIEDLAEGDLVVTSDGSSVRVKTLLKKSSSIMIRITLSDGRSLSVTPGHPFFTDIGWVRAENLLGRIVFREEELHALRSGISSLQDEKILRDILLSEVEDESARDPRQGTQSRSSREECCGVSRSEARTGVEPWQAVDRGVEKTDERSPQEGGALVGDQSWRERSRTYETSEDTTEHPRRGLDGGVCYRVGRQAAWLSYLLQSGLSVPCKEDGYRVRRGEPQETEASGREEGRKTDGTRVVSCKAEQLSHPVDVYDLQLAGCPHFFAGDVLVHNCTFVKNPSAARSKRCVQLARLARYRRIMTGSPVTRSPLDVYGQMTVLQERPLGFSSYYSFRARYAVTKKMDVGGRKFDVVVGYREVDDLQKRLAPHAFRVTKAECLDLPPKVYLRRDVELTDEQRRLYDEMKTYAMAEITAGGPVMQATTVIAQILRLHQLVCGYVVDEDGVEHPVGSARVDALLETVEEAPGKVIVWSRYRRCIADVVAALTKAYGPRSVVEYHGGTSAAERAAAVARFQGTGEVPHDPECRFIVSNPQVGGFGNTWTRGTTEVFYANSYDLELRVQAEDRPHRAGQTESVTIVDLVAPGTVDEKILKALREKINLASAVLGEAYREWLI